ncbi:hypothetical protein J7E73_16050 [Paenibacillus albidus]|uniref:hypothetical protein n=1 Tax=Paenibacillus albidus TaxID=2041023 RepID=UPI001BECA2D3|nr:hypothetical protein [Paenibacillus albidus]MBT2290613.1 hypothetical protein [Paenibacillus albidus]
MNPFETLVRGHDSPPFWAEERAAMKDMNWVLIQARVGQTRQLIPSAWIDYVTQKQIGTDGTGDWGQGYGGNSGCARTVPTAPMAPTASSALCFRKPKR